MRFSKILRLNLPQRAIGDSIASPLLRRSDEETSLRRDYEASTTAHRLGQILVRLLPCRPFHGVPALLRRLLLRLLPTRFQHRPQPAVLPARAARLASFLPGWTPNSKTTAPSRDVRAAYLRCPLPAPPRLITIASRQVPIVANSARRGCTPYALARSASQELPEKLVFPSSCTTQCH